MISLSFSEISALGGFCDEQHEHVQQHDILAVGCIADDDDIEYARYLNGSLSRGWRSDDCLVSVNHAC